MKDILAQALAAVEGVGKLAVANITADVALAAAPPQMGGQSKGKDTGAGIG